MTPEDLIKLLAVFLTTIAGTWGTLKVRDRRNPSNKELIESLVVERHDLKVDNEAKQHRIAAQEAIISQHKEDMAAVNAKIDLLKDQLESQEKRHTQERVDDVRRHTEELAGVKLERETFKQTTQREIDDLKRQLAQLQLDFGQVRQRNNELERINHLLENRQAECEQYEVQVGALQGKLDASEKREAGLQMVIDRLAREENPPAPPTVDLPVQPKNDA